MALGSWFTPSDILGLLLSLVMIYILDPGPLHSLAIIFMSFNAKMTPLLGPTVRIVPALSRYLLFPAPPPFTVASALFRPVSSRSRTGILECDVALHKTNSSYLLDLDVSRADLLSRVFTRPLRKVRNSRMILAGVDISFRREIKPLQQYKTCSCLLTWDEKWIYILSCHTDPSVEVDESGEFLKGLFERRKQEGLPLATRTPSQIFTVAVSKYVAKAGKRTLPPGEIFKIGSLLTSTVDTEWVQMRRAVGLELLRTKSTAG